ncbi:hypothetical protein [Burkholderia cepacia]|uniref:hypothetical protein n=1 Tax=Burkholderia cepacia TaxID=292 RepID=UPI0018C51CF9|nr:hypothetical protein [Burkholderia cepacia]
MRQIVNYVAPKKVDERERKRVQMAVYRVLQALAESGQVIIKERSTNGAPATYSWRVLEPAKTVTCAPCEPLREPLHFGGGQVASAHTAR